MNLPYGSGWDSQLIEFYQVCRRVAITEREDHWNWAPFHNFTISSATTALVPAQVAVPWAKIVWSKRHLPRFALILWMAVWERLPTLEKLAQWGIVDTNRCLLCRLEPENLNHLFLCARSPTLFGLPHSQNCNVLPLHIPGNTSRTGC